MHFLSNFLVLGPHKGEKRVKNEAEVGQKHKIVDNNASNAIEVL